jgi:hypothetical protein
MKILTGNYEVFSSGSVNSDGLKPITFKILEDGKFDVIFQVVFNEESSSISYDVTAPNEITFSFYNPNLIDWGFPSPVKIGYIDDKELHVIFRVTIHGDRSSFSLSYSFYLTEKAND